MSQCSPGLHARQLAVYRRRVSDMPALLATEVLAPDQVAEDLAEAHVTWRERQFPPQVTLWTFLLQVLSPDGSCREAVTRVRALRAAHAQVLPSPNTGSYCKARRRPLVQLRDYRGATEVLRDPEPEVAYDGPLAVLVNRYSASASEIFAAAMQDYKRGVVIGQQTFGKGSVQNLYSLDNYTRARDGDPGLGQLTLTIGKYYRVTGGSTQHRGVHPDISLPSEIDTEMVGESTRETALPWDRIEPIDFAARAPLDAAVSALTERHEQRVVNDPDYTYVIGGISAYEDLREQEWVSLNLEARKRERVQQDQQNLARENARRAAHGLEPLKSLEELDDAEPPDFTLTETAEIVADMLNLYGPHAVASGATASSR